MQHFFEAKEVILIADSKRKAEIVKRVVEETPSCDVPASLMNHVEGAVLYIDDEAASLLK